MAKGIREEFVQALVNAGFRKPEAESLTATWIQAIRPVFLNLLETMARAVRDDYQEGVPLTNEATIAVFREATTVFQEKR